MQRLKTITRQPAKAETIPIDVKLEFLRQLLAILPDTAPKETPVEEV